MCQTDGLNWKRTELNAGSTCSLLIDITALAGFLFLGAGITAKGSLRLLHYRQHSSKFYSFNVRNLFPSRQVFNILTMSPEASGMQGWECRPSWSVQTETTTWWIAVKSRRHFWPSEDESHQLWWSTDHFCSTTSWSALLLTIHHMDFGTDIHVPHRRLVYDQILATIGIPLRLSCGYFVFYWGLADVSILKPLLTS